MALCGLEIFNSARLDCYLGSVGSGLDSVGTCVCENFDHETLGHLPYVNPAYDLAPWYDPDIPESADFAGLMVLSVDGMDDHPMERTVTRSVTGGAALGPSRALPRTITVTGLLLGATCCGVAFGMRWLSQALGGCTGDGCGGDCLTVYNCCPSATETPAEFKARHRRTLRRVALTEGPRVIARRGDACSGSTCCSAGSDIITVEFVLTAGTPWLWTDAEPVLEIPVPTDDGTGCITWCVHNAPGDNPDPFCFSLDNETCLPGGVRLQFDEETCDVLWPATDEPLGPCDTTCRLKPCEDMASRCVDPACRVPVPPAPVPPETCFCHALGTNDAYCEMDLSCFPKCFGTVPIISVRAGSSDLKRVTIKFFERRPEHEGMTCAEVAEVERCNPHSVFEVAFVPAGGVMILDGQVGRAFVECMGDCGGSPDAFGGDGGPLEFPLLDCDSYCVQISADALATPASDSSISVALSGREY